MSDKPDHVVRQAAEDIWSRRAPDAFERWHSPDFQNHTAPPGLDSSLASFKQVQTQFRSAFSETSVQILEQVIEGDREPVASGCAAFIPAPSWGRSRAAKLSRFPECGWIG